MEVLKKNNKNKLLLLVFAILLYGNYGFADVLLPTPDEARTLQLKQNVKKQTSKLVITEQEEFNELVKIQQESEIEDLEMLWQATVDNNKLIKFTVEKLNTPEGQQRLHSSLAAKTLSAVVYGASFLPSLAGQNSAIQSASFATGKLLHNLMNKKAMPQPEMLSDTELIELAGTIEELQDNIISAYYGYKSSLSKLKDIRSRIILANKNYSKALRTGNILEISLSSSLYDELALNEFQEEQEAKKYHLALERLAGPKVVSQLKLSQYAYKNALINPSEIKSNNKRNEEIK